MQLKPTKTDFLCICRDATLVRTLPWAVVFLGCKCHKLRHIVCLLPLWLEFQFYPCLVSGHQDWVSPKPPCHRIISYCDHQKLFLPFLHCHARIPLYPFHEIFVKGVVVILAPPPPFFLSSSLPIPHTPFPPLSYFFHHFFLTSAAVCWWAAALSFSEEGRGIMLSPNSGRPALSCL